MQAVKYLIAKHDLLDLIYRTYFTVKKNSFEAKKKLKPY